MIKKNIIIISLIFIFSSCGFSPIYLKNNNINFSIEEISFKGDRELNNFIKSNLNQYKKREFDNKYFIEMDSIFNKVILSKDGTGEVTNYQLEAVVTFFIKPINKKIKITEKKIMKSMSDKFEETKYEKSIKQSFASSIVSKLTLKLTIN
tara:strand:+ start:65 stop:514 length:450 start_codon:yes stop_codon:yes gene_type:complete